uniref:Uncharacterized protein n=2 Tax=Cucumis melo TaxID=3656 RepID=A0A9I9DZ21_CUCME|nr:hypothetical protein [Cucumis melo subsp. melo]
MTQKQIEERLIAAEMEMGRIRKELQRLPVLKRRVEVISVEMKKVQKMLKLLVEKLILQGGREGENDFHRGRLREEKSSRARNGWLRGQKDEGMEECELSWQKFADGDGGRSKFKKVEKPIFQRRRPRWVAL